MKMSIDRFLKVGAIVVIGLGASVAIAADDGGEPTHFPIKKPKEVSWSFAGPFGSFDKQQLQRGFQVYREACAACHSMKLVHFRNLGEPGALGYNSEQVKAIAAEYEVTDGPDEAGDMFERPGKPFDAFPSPFENDNAAAASNNNAVPPDFSLIAKARAVERGFPLFLFDVLTQYQEGGPDYIYSLLTGFVDAPEGTELPEGTYYNPYFASGVSLSMAPPLSDEQVEYTDGSPMTVDQYARDVTAFLMWAAEPKLEARKRIGLQVMIFLIVFAALLYLVKRKIWSDVAH